MTESICVRHIHVLDYYPYYDSIATIIFPHGCQYALHAGFTSYLLDRLKRPVFV
ncbi:hypothetical protein BABINDRAFT_111152 [Babjeviella inositovora NRRL Y-12698]|uniref:Uncharacterized protein n=1 Tax=Babjeviella inositovora NRRL Y-12698 TaxID=984486 RepID=A0A1E3QXK4_9ASCO|nr:uncharacterized protein BABINDRAFT_111152 [Babjeviella inositovora NRRL Y-12698]ODQ81767.1 hypothetical protein BABINDRAFT_111152 [Babjeviella inositovora NRRL Y-12698]